MNNKPTYRQYLQSVADTNTGGANGGNGVWKTTSNGWDAQQVLNYAGDDGRLNDSQKDNTRLNSLNNAFVDEYNRLYNTNNQEPIYAPTNGNGNDSFDASWYQDLINSLGQEKGQASNMIRNSYGSSLNSLRTERDQAVENLDREETKLNDQRSRSLSTLSNDLSKLWQNANVQLGMFGAGNSSAAQAAAYGVSDMANKEATATNDEFNDQVGDINLARRGYNREYEDKRNTLEDKMNNDIWKSDRGYDSQITGMRGDIANKTDNQAIRQQQVDAIRNQYGNLQAPNEKLNLAAYDGAGVQNRGIGGTVAVNNPSAPQAQYFQAANTRRKEDERTAY